MSQELLRVEDLAKVLKVPASWVYSQTRQTGPGTMPRIRCGKYVRFIESEVLAWLRERSKDRNR
jgi:excisionase family DNA binding protein